MTDRKSFILYTDYMNHIQLLDMEQRGMLFTAIMEYAMAGETDEDAMDGMTRMAFSFIKAQMDRDSDKYDEIIEKRREAGKLGGRPSGEKAKKANGFSEKAKKANGFSEKQTKAKKPDNDNVTDTVNDNDTDNVTDTVNDNDTDIECIKTNTNKNNKSDKDNNSKGRKAPVIYYPNDEKLDQTFRDYVAMRKAIKKPMTDQAITLAMNKLEKLADRGGVMDNDLAIQILEQSILNSWQGLFPLKEEPERKNVFDEWRSA